MGKCLRKAKPSGEVADAHFGVRTRARSLALQLQEHADLDYLQLRSRRLEKPSPRKATGRTREEEVGDEASDSCERDARESTPCSMILGSDSGTPGSTTRSRTSNIGGQRAQSISYRFVPTTHELEEFFAGAEELQQKIFMDKYNYDIVNDCPIPGRFEWVELNS